MNRTFSEIASLICNGKRLPLVTDHDPSISLPNERGFFVNPSLKSKNGFSESSPFMIISAPGATGKSAFGYNISIERNAIYWDLSKANIGDNYFIGTLTKSFGVSQLSKVLEIIQNGELAFIIDAFDEAELSCGWSRINSFLEEIHKFGNIKSGISFILLARYETAQYLSLILDDLLGESKYYYYEIEFFSKDSSKDFLHKYLIAKDPKYRQIKGKIDQIANIIFNGIDQVMDITTNVNSRLAFYGYAPVLQAIAILIDQYPNLQELENKYISERNYNEITENIIRNIIEREREKVVSAFRNRLEQKSLPVKGIESLYSENEQLLRLVMYVSAKRIDVSSYSISEVDDSIVGEYQEVLQQFLPQHPFIFNADKFSSPAFKDFAYANLLSKGIVPIDQTSSFYSAITPLFWQYYLSSRKEKTIDGEHVGIMCESAIAGKKSGEDLITAIYNTMDGAELSTIVQLGEQDKTLFYNCKIITNSAGDIHFPFHMKNMFIKCDKKIILGSGSNDFLITNTSINVKEIEFRCKKLTIRCDERDKPITIYSSIKVKHPDALKVNKIGEGDLIISWPEGNKFPWAEHYKEIETLEEKNVDNLLLSLRQILKWFRKDRRDSIARYADFIDNVAINGNSLNKRMLEYLFDTHVIWKDGGLYKLSHKVAEKNGINFSSMKNMVCNDLLQSFLEKFDK